MSNVRKRLNGKYEARGMLNGRTFSAYGETSKEAKNKLEKILNEAVSLSDERKCTLAAWLEEWLTTYKKPNLSLSGYKSIEICIRLHIPQTLKETPLFAVSTCKIQAALNSIGSSRMRKYTFDVLNEAFRKAYAISLITLNPMLNVEPVQHVRKQGESLSDIEQAKFLQDIATHHLKPLFLFYLCTGVRRGEALSLQWEDVNLSAGTVLIRGTKTASSYRVITLSPIAKNILSDLPHDSSALLVFPYKADYITYAFKKLCPAHRLHDLRHTFATRCLESNIQTRVVQLWLGHSRLDTTARIYTHVLNGFQSEQAEKFSLTPLTKQ